MSTLSLTITPLQRRYAELADIRRSQYCSHQGIIQQVRSCFTSGPTPFDPVAPVRGWGAEYNLQDAAENLSRQSSEGTHSTVGLQFRSARNDFIENPVELHHGVTLIRVNRSGQ